MQRPTVKTKCVADSYHGPNERIVEFSALSAINGRLIGGLLSFRVVDDQLVIDVYRTDAGVVVRCDPAVIDR